MVVCRVELPRSYGRSWNLPRSTEDVPQINYALNAREAFSLPRIYRFVCSLSCLMFVKCSSILPGIMFENNPRIPTFLLEAFVVARGFSARKGKRSYFVLRLNFSDHYIKAEGMLTTSSPLRS